MASGSVPAASVAASSVVVSPTTSSSATSLRRPPARAVAFRVAHRPKLSLFSAKVCGDKFGTQKTSVLVKSQPAEVVDAPANAVDIKPGGVPTDDVAESHAMEMATTKMSAEAVSVFMDQVSSLVKLVDSRDIVELHLKQQDCEVVIRKKEALPQPPPMAPVVLPQPHGTPVLPPQFLQPPPTIPAAPTSAAAAALQAAPGATATPEASAKSSVPPLKSPMAGTFYRNPGPGQPPFVKVGDKVNKGQVLCIIEAMKLMNEIEADHAGTVAEILVEDSKPVSIDQPLFIIEP